MVIGSSSFIPKTRLACWLFFAIPLGLQANPVMLNPVSLIAFWMVAFWALAIESSIATLVLSFCGMVFWPVFATLLIANFGTFAFGFMPLAQRMPLWLLEPLVIVFDAIMIKLVSAVSAFQRGDYVGVSWRQALLASALGNAASYFIGVLASESPWLDHGSGSSD